MTALLEFADGVAASLTYSGYDRFDTDEFHGWIGEDGAPREPAHGNRRRANRAYRTPADELRARTERGFAGSGVVAPGAAMHDPHFGFVVASCERADLRPSPHGVLVYDDDGVRELPAPPARVYPNRDRVIDEFYEALALLQSARERRIITLNDEEHGYALG
jgi:phthalate 4,5-cis-dihydrodiol dehydrogenase